MGEVSPLVPDGTSAPRLQPLETKVDGVRMKSRQEARYAVLFSALRWKWRYEVEGFHLSNAYLPDFEVRMTPSREGQDPWAYWEIKPERKEPARGVDLDPRWIDLARASGRSFYVVYGDPELKPPHFERGQLTRIRFVDGHLSVCYDESGFHIPAGFSRAIGVMRGTRFA